MPEYKPPELGVAGSIPAGRAINYFKYLTDNISSYFLFNIHNTKQYTQQRVYI